MTLRAGKIDHRIAASVSTPVVARYHFFPARIHRDLIGKRDTRQARLLQPAMLLRTFRCAMTSADPSSIFALPPA